MISEMAYMPENTIALLLDSKTGTRKESPIVIPEGKRNDFLCSIAGYFRGRGFAANQIESLLLTVNKVALKPAEEASRIHAIASGSDKWKTQLDKYVTRLSDVEETVQEYVLRKYIPCRTVTVLEGDPGVGKSTLLGEIAACVTTGKKFCGLEPDRTGSLFFFAIEDEPTSVFKIRARLQGADQSKIYYANEPLDLTDEGLQILEHELSVRKHELVIVDTLSSSLAGEDQNKSGPMGNLLKRLRGIASTYDVAILVVRHLRKGGSDNPLYAGSGSIAITGGVRSAVMVRLSPDNPGQRYLAHSKSNGARRGDTLIFSIDDVPPEEVGKLVWHGTSPLSAEDVACLRMPDPSQVESAEEFLKSYLSKGAKKSSSIFSAAKESGISSRTLNRAKSRLGIISKGGPGSKWSLPKQSVPNSDE